MTDQPAPQPKDGVPLVPQQPEPAERATSSTPTLDELVDNLPSGYRSAREVALKADLGVQKLVIRDLVRSGESALASVNLHSGEQGPAQRLSTFLHDLRREDWVKKAQSVATVGMGLVGVDTGSLVVAALGALISGFLVVAVFVAEVTLGIIVLAASSGVPVLWMAARGASLGAESLARFFAEDMPGAGLVSAHIAEPERRLYAVTGGRPPLLRVTDSAGHAVKIGIAAIVAAVLLGAFLGLATFFAPATPM